MIIQNLFSLFNNEGNLSNNLHWTYLMSYDDAGKHIKTIGFSDFETIVQLQLTQFYMEMLRSDHHEF